MDTTLRDSSIRFNFNYSLSFIQQQLLNLGLVAVLFAPTVIDFHPRGRSGFDAGYKTSGACRDGDQSR